MAETNALNDMVSLKPYPNVSAFLSGTKQEPTPKGYIGEPEIFPAQQELQQARAKAKEDIGKADINIEKAKREEQASKMQVDVDVEKESAERIKEMPERMALKAKQEEASALKFMPTKDTAQDIAGLFGLVGVISMALGGGGRMSGHLALGNMNAMMEGYRKGRTDLNKKEAVEFDKNFKSMQAALETLSREYKDALEIEKSDKERGRLERHMTLAKAGSPVLKAMEERLGPVRVNDFLNELQTTMDKSVTLHNSLQKYADDRQAKKEAAQQAADLKAALAGGRRDEKILQSIGPALRNIAEQYPEGTAMSLAGASPDDKKRVQGAFRAVEESEKVADFVARNPNAVGALAVAKNFLRVDAIKSLQSEDEATVAASKAAVIDQQLDEGVEKGQISKDDAEAAKLLQKKLFALALADVQGSGQRGSVYLDRQFQNLYDQASRDTTLVKIIRERAEENNRNLKAYKLNIERNNNPEQFPLVEARSVEDYMKERKPKSGVPDNVEKALKGKPEASGVKSGGKTYRIYGGVVKEVQE